MKTPILAVATVLLAAMPAVAQKPSDCAPGVLEVIRFSGLKPGKTLADFQKAVDLQMAWYRKHGFTENRQLVMPVMTATGTSPTEVVTIHINPPGVAQDQRDAGWDDFTAAFREVSTIEQMRAVCRPK